MSPMRWSAVVTYRTENGLLDVPMDVEEIADLDEAIERGPSFYSIETIVIRHAHQEEPLTVEQTEAL